VPGALLPLLGGLTSLVVPASVAQVENAVFAHVRAEAGSAPRSPGADPEGALALELQPGAALRLTLPRSQLRLVASPRLYYRTPNLADVDRPLFLVQADADYTYDFDPRTRLASKLDVSYGEVDYTNAPAALGTPLAGELEQASLEVLNVNVEGTLTFQLRPRHTLSVGALAHHTDDVGVEASSAFPTTTTVGVELAYGYALDERSTLSFPVQPRYYFVDPGSDWFSTAFNAAFVRQLDLRTTVDARGGLVLVDTRDSALSVYPSAAASIERVVLERRGTRVTNRAGVVLDANLDPTIGEVRPALGVELSALSYFGPRWSAGLSLSAYTNTTTREAAEEEPTTDDTTLSSTLSAGYRVGMDAWLDFGARFYLRGTNIIEDDFDVVERQIWGFVTFRIAVGIGELQSEAGWAL